MSLPIPSSTGAGTPLGAQQLQALDAPLIALTQQCGGDLRRLMFAFFSFLHRRTDFYLVPNAADDASMGFREGDAEKLLIAAFRQFPLRRIPKGQASTAATSSGGGGSKKALPPSTTTSKATATTTTTTTASPKKKAENLESKKAASPTSKTDTNVGDSSPANSSAAKSEAPKSKAPEKTNEDAPKSDAKNKTNLSDIQYSEEGFQIPVGNGGSTKAYKWTQTIDECSVLIGVPKNLRGKDLQVTITPSTICVQSKRPLPGEESHRTFVKGKLSAKIRPDESTWSVEGGVVIVTLDKLQKSFWTSILEGDDKIDTELVDNRRHIGEYDDVTQAQIRKIIFDQEQYHKGGPTSDEILGKKDADIPTLPAGVEYIDKKKLDDEERKKKEAAS